MRDLFQVLQVIVGQVFDLLSTFVEFLWNSSISMPTLNFVGVVMVAFLLGLLLGRLSTHRVSEVSDLSKEGEADRIPLDLDKLRPLGLSAEEEVEAGVMDISSIQSDETIEGTSQGDLHRRQRAETGPQR